MSEREQQPGAASPQRGGLLGWLRRLFGRGRDAENAAPPATVATDAEPPRFAAWTAPPPLEGGQRNAAEDTTPAPAGPQDNAPAQPAGAVGGEAALTERQAKPLDALRSALAAAETTAPQAAAISQVDEPDGDELPAQREEAAPPSGAATPATPIERARSALEEARRQMAGLMGETSGTKPEEPGAQTAQPERGADGGRTFAAEWPGLLEGLRQTRAGLAGEIDTLRAIVHDLRREVGRLSDIVNGLQQQQGGTASAAAPAPAPALASLSQTLPRLQTMLERLRAMATEHAAAAPRAPLASAEGPLTPPSRAQMPTTGQLPPLAPEIVWAPGAPHQHAFAPTLAPQSEAAPEPARPSPSPAPRTPAMLLTITPLEGIARLSALEQRLAATPGVQRLELSGYRRGEASFRVTLAGGATIHDAIRRVPDATTTIAEVRVEDNVARVRLAPRGAREVATAPS